ncbi:MAG: pseudouridine-5'-phosphate glycosidase [Bacteroidetes bacterium]|nr:pseudouridine-5'-phosphate glycosidase [Bacteroidota bacterium]MDA1333423.1 pseudouridine-5'-phosphate glycosidase [Bacteroidota bacterium]
MSDLPCVALESTVLSHGLPFPANLTLSETLDRIVRSEGAIPRTIGIISGTVKTDLNRDEIRLLCQDSGVRKVSIRDLPIVISRAEHGATTVASTIHLAHRSGIQVMATGGIGGIHLDAHGQPSMDESADLQTLSQCPVCVVCSGPKAILHLEATRERLETLGVTVVGWKTDFMTAFYCGSSPFEIDARCDDLDELASIIEARDAIGLQQAVVVCNPVPTDHEIPFADVISCVKRALIHPDAAKLRPAAVTPYLLDCVRKDVGDAALQANIALLESNAQLAARLAKRLAERST